MVNPYFLICRFLFFSLSVYARVACQYFQIHGSYFQPKRDSVTLQLKM